MVERNLKVQINTEHVLRQLECRVDSELYEEIVEEYKAIEAEVYALCDPVLLAEYGTYEDKPVLMVLYSIGKGVSEFATKWFKEGDYLKGMLANAMADSALFSMENEIAPYLKEFCAEIKMGISRRLEAPQDMPMSVQRVIFEKTKAQERCGMHISSGDMFEPVKSNAVLYALTPDPNQFLYQHNCRNCERYDCQHRNVPDIPVKVIDGEKEYALMVKERESILEALMEAEPSYSAVCGGIGKCGKCRIKVQNGQLPVTAFDSQCFDEKELNEGMRLACKAYPTESTQVKACFKRDEHFVIVSEHEQSQGHVGSKQNGSYGVAIDIGTTTIAIQLVDLNKTVVVNTYTAINHQRRYGVDVISRINASSNGKKEELQTCIQNDLKQGIKSVICETKVSPACVTEVVIAGNTTMTHLLMGYDCKGLGEYPFTPVNMQLIEDTYENVLKDNFIHSRIRILPGISAFVGGDVVSGLYAEDIDRKEKYSLLIDLGTNGEMALGNQNKILVTSTAAGPAFEGGNIECGVGSIEGAIVGVEMKEGKAQVDTIGDKAPVGICGTGVIEAVAELCREKLLDETGCFSEDYFETGYLLARTEDGADIFLTQQDIREIQLAKAALRAGMETLFLRYGIRKEEVAHVYLAGGFGFQLSCQKAIKIGMLPKEFEDRIKIIGNSSLSGAVKCLLNLESWKRVVKIGQNSQEINLSTDKDFNRLYMEYMYFN